MRNQRNFYRILHVQPEAPLEIIKASYRSLMTKLKAHPDLGGDHDTAVLINQAYAVLSDPKKRKTYDELLSITKKLGRENPLPKSARQPFTTPGYPRSSRSTSHHERADEPEKMARCLFCGTENLQALPTNQDCKRCASPLTPVQIMPHRRKGEFFCRRSAPRIAKVSALILYPDWPHIGFPAELHDMSLSGIGLLTAYNAHDKQILKFDAVPLKGIAQVVSVRKHDTSFSVHATFLTAAYSSKAGWRDMSTLFK
jgi:hypothetical protein